MVGGGLGARHPLVVAKMIEALKDMPWWQFVLLWVWLIVTAVAPVGWLVAVFVALKALHK